MIFREILSAALKGILHSFKGMFAIFYIDKEINKRNLGRVSPTKANAVRQRLHHKKISETKKVVEDENSTIKILTKQVCLNGGIFLGGKVFVEFGLLPVFRILFQLSLGQSDLRISILLWIEGMILFMYRTFWIIPLISLSKIISTVWCQSIATCVFQYSNGKPVSNTSMANYLADFIFTLVIQGLFLIQATAVSYIPIPKIAKISSVILMSILYSLYCFEYKWINMGWQIHKRLAFIEENWPYFIGFSLPLAIFTEMSPTWDTSACVFALLFPFYIVSANQATPVQIPSGYAIHVFSPVISISNMIFRKTLTQEGDQKTG